MPIVFYTYTRDMETEVTGKWLCIYLLMTISGYIKALLVYCNPAGLPIKMSCDFPKGGV